LVSLGLNLGGIRDLLTGVTWPWQRSKIPHAVIIMQLLKSRNALLFSEYQDLAKKKILLLTACNNLNTSELSQLRNKLSGDGISVKMLKTSVFKRALDENSSLKTSLNGPVIAWSSDREAGEVGKLITKALILQPRIHLLAARIENEEWTREGSQEVLERLSTRSQVQERLLSVLQAPVMALHAILQQPSSLLTSLLSCKKE
jgi:ribosomal protein L10